jgi:hypothetical protein
MDGKEFGGPGGKPAFPFEDEALFQDRLHLFGGVVVVHRLPVPERLPAEPIEETLRGAEEEEIPAGGHNPVDLPDQGLEIPEVFEGR